MEVYNTLTLPQDDRFEGWMTGQLMFFWKLGLLPRLPRAGSTQAW